ncbi:MAG: hypothetical protein ACO1OQ_06595 [Rufibacter sp.]
MKKLIHLIWLLAAPFLMASCAEDEEFAPNPFSELTSSVIYSNYTNNGYIPKEEPAAEMRVYAGDTIRYAFQFKSNQGFKSMKVYDNLRGRDWPLVINGATSKQDGLTVADYTLEYIVNQDVVKAQPGETITLTVEVEEEDGTLYINPLTGRNYEVKLTLAHPLVYQKAKLYNYWGNEGNSLVIVDYRLANDIPRQGLISDRYLSPFALVCNKMPPRDWFVNRFEHSFASGEVEGNRQATFVKVPAAAKSWDQPNQIARAMKQYGPASATVENVQVGDVFAFQARYPFGSSWVIYGLIEVKSIVDDQKTAATGGHDEDYMELDIKYFPGYRY